RFLGKCGAVVWGHLSVAMLRDPAGNPRLTVVVCEDITARVRANEERARLERRLQETQRLESLGVLAGGVAHDFNNILTSIQGNADMALLSLADNSPARPFLEQIGQAVTRASELTGQMLAYAGRRRTPAGRVDVNRAIGEISDLLRVSHMRHCGMRFNLRPGLPLVHAEATQVRQIVLNLVVNAAESIDASGGEVVVSTGADELGRAALDGLVLGADAAPGSFVRVSVSDSGCGMDSATMARIFDPFFTTKLLGTGLGLAAVHGIVREHRGALWVQSTPGSGTIFHIWLPAAAV
ncbi:MAG: PAS domain S-box protein, partial [Chloroflexales bacterium]|nr:PAS domain S-box protein [Chloroflexales bacterium]